MFASAIALTFALGAPAPKVPPKAEPAKMDGAWVLQIYVLGGKVDEKRKDMHFTFDKDTVTVKEEGGVAIGYTLNPKTKPAGIDLMADKEATIPGIYKIEGDTLTICFAKGGKDKRPAKFESPEGSRVVIMTLKRDKKD